MAPIPIIGALLEASGMIIEKKLLKQKNLDYRNYPVYSFFAIVLISIITLIFSWHVEPAALEYKNVLIFAAVIAMAVGANLLTYYSLKKENISEFEPFWMMQTFFVVILAVIFYNEERNWITVGATIVASVALIISHIKRHHLAFDRYNLAVLLASILFACELVLSKQILKFYSPVSLYFIRCLFIFFILLAIYKPKFNIIGKKTWGWIFLTALMWVACRAVIYYGYANLGVVYTMSLIIISPVLLLLFAIIFLHEKPSAKQIICNCIILACVAVSSYFGQPQV